MKQNLLTKLTILAGSALFSGLSLAGDSPAPAAPAASDVSVSISAGYTSEYVYRGGYPVSYTHLTLPTNREV